MDIDKLRTKLANEEIFTDDPLFYQYAFSLTAQERKLSYIRESDNFKRTCVEEYDELSKRVDLTKFQESCSVRNVLRTRRLANLLINDKGEVNLAVLPRLIELLKQNLYSLGPDRQYDSVRQEHLLNVLIQLNENKDLQRSLNTITRPMAHKFAEQIIRDTVQLPSNVTLTDAHAKRAALASWMCYLRQNVGSCFATAPAIIIHDEQPGIFFKDLNELLSTGRLKRTYGGIEYSVPLSSSWGAGDLKKPFILPIGEDFEESGMWLSPGLSAAFLAAGLLDPNLENSHRDQMMKALLQSMVDALPLQQSYIIITAEEIIRWILLKHLGLTEQDIHDYENKPQGMIHSGLLMQVARTGNSPAKAKNELCASFQLQFLIACNALKALTDNALLKAWEFTIASFSETKSQFTRWNLYASLGLDTNDAGGIGVCLYEIIKRKLDTCNERAKEVQYDYEQVFTQLKTMEMRMRSASTEKEAQWIKIEYQTKRNEFYTLEEIRDEVNNKAQRFANLYNVIIDEYDALFPRYFQEVYDADMHDIAAGPYDDSPAGFRLLYKYGRSNTSQWSRIKTPNEFIDDLASFFIATETELTASPNFEGLQNELSEIITAIVSHIRTREFLETAFYRMAAAHHTPIVKDPLEHLDKIDKKPWAYTSGGTMGTLVSCYYKREQKPTEVSRWVESPIELLVFLADTLKQMPHKLTEPYLENPGKSMLIHSPTHAFLIKPGLDPFKQAWHTDAYTYTWIRDNMVAPQQKFIDSLWLNEESMAFLVQHFAKIIPVDYRHYFMKTFGNIYGAMRPPEFRDYLIDGIHKERGFRRGGAGGTILPEDNIDSVLFSMLPLFQRSQLREKLEQMFAKLPFIEAPVREQLLEIYESATRSVSYQTVVSSTSLQNICKGLICLAFGQTSLNIDCHVAVARAAQQLGFAMPAPIIFADTNWVKEMFGFLVNPGSGRFELWRVDPVGTSGSPMSSWNQWLNGSRQDITWGIYTRPYEYSI